MNKCPDCGSPKPYLHPALQHEGEVSPCLNVWHARITPERPMHGFQAEQWDWVKRTFPDETADGAYRHFLEEAKELGDDVGDGEELADCFLLILCLASHAGIDLSAAARAKFDKCKSRKWVKTDTGYRHVKEDHQ